VTIDYTYDGLYRLTAAEYSTGEVFEYTYDATGNRLSQTVTINEIPITTTYTYDDANRLSQVDAQAYTWDNNGNLLSDGERYYYYDPANRLTALVEGEDTTYYLYNGQGDRIAQIEDGVQTPYILDLNAGLTQVLNDGMTAYVYGLDLVSQQTGIYEEYPLRDALGSVRQVTDQSSAITGSRNYEPYGSVLSSSGEESMAYGFAGEWTDASGMQYLRARYYDPYLNQFIQADTIVPNPNTPWELNSYSYVGGNPINFVDPSGKTRVYPSDNDLSQCVGSTILQGVDTSVRYDVCRLIPDLEKAGFFADISDEDHVTVGYRDQKIAHRVSTAYHILHDLITIDELKETPQDVDGTVWYKEEWNLLFPECDDINIALDWLRDLRIKQNASAQVPPEYNQTRIWFGVLPINSPSYALEGYASGDQHRLPNSDNPPISKHTLGLAVDIGDPGKSISDSNALWDPKIDEISRKYNLVRPYHNLMIDYANMTINEWWHFERP
jgi:RHS repeat-associated protein